MQRRLEAERSAFEDGEFFFKCSTDREWVACMALDTGTVFLSIQIPPAYPFAKPTVFINHPRVTCAIVMGGAICAEALYDWAPCMTIDSLLRHIAIVLKENAAVVTDGSYTTMEHKSGDSIIKRAHKDGF